MTDKQKQWTEDKVLAIKNQYIPQMPLSDEAWEQVIADIKVIQEKSKMHVEVKEELMKLVRYLEIEDKKKRSSENE